MEDSDYMKDDRRLLELLTPRMDIRASEALRGRVVRSMGRARRAQRRNLLLRVLVPVSAAAALLAIILFPSGLSASELLKSALNALNQEYAVTVELDVRTARGDNFSYINESMPFVRHKLRSCSADSVFVWSADKGARKSCGTQTESWTWLEDGIGWHMEATPEQTVDYISIFLTPSKIIESELATVMAGGASDYNMERKGLEIKLEVRSHASGDFTNPYMLNRSIAESENVRTYVFDSRTYLLKRASVRILDSKGREVEVLRLHSISFGHLDASSIAALPDDVYFLDKMSVPHGFIGADASEVAGIFLKSLETWDTSVIYRLLSPEEAELLYRRYLAGAKVLDVGAPFVSGNNPDLVFVPYTIQYATGDMADCNIAIRRSADGGWRVSGGI